MGDRKSWAGITAGAALLLALVGGCSPGDGGGVVTPSATNPPTPEVSVPVVTASAAGVHEAPALKAGATSVLMDVRLSKCESGPGAVTSSGTVTNHADAARDIVVTASWNTPDNSKTFAKASAVLKGVPAGATRGYEIKSNVEAPKDTAVVCTYSALSGSLK